jgi:MFS family permease
VTSVGTNTNTGLVLLTLEAGQFLITLDSSVVNASIASVAKDIGTTFTGIQIAIPLYMLVMTMLMAPAGRSVRRSAESVPS